MERLVAKSYKIHNNEGYKTVHADTVQWYQPDLSQAKRKCFNSNNGICVYWYNGEEYIIAASGDVFSFLRDYGYTLNENMYVPYSNGGEPVNPEYEWGAALRPTQPFTYNKGGNNLDQLMGAANASNV